MINLKDILEIKSFDNRHLILEMAIISDDNDKLPNNAQVIIYPEKDIQGTKTPHFHLKINHGEIEFEIKLQNIKELSIWRSKNKKYKDWSGLSNVKKAIELWVFSKAYGMENTYNWELLIAAWNRSNPTNRIDKEYLNI